MTTPRFTLTLLACASLLPLLAACGTPDGGYYDANGNYNPTDTPHNTQQDAHSPLPGGTRDYRADRGYYENNNYNRRGYYDGNGYYIARNNGFTVPDDMFPPRGMCRVWFTERDPSQQPAVESCNGIKARVPAGAYVIFGG